MGGVYLSRAHFCVRFYGSTINHGADILNASIGWCPGTTQMDVIDKAFDYYARTENRMVVVAAGNNDPNCPFDYVNSPAKGWNVLSVGAYDDHNDANWSNDTMAGFSEWVNPASIHNDHEKPEIVAPGVAIESIGADGNLAATAVTSGTSFSAPQVAGLAALLIHRNASLRAWPEAGRAIIMASAVHNIDGPSNIPSGQDLKDGAGGIDAALADTVAANGTTDFSNTTPCSGPCWWGLSINSSNFPVGSYLYRSFKASRGEHIRTAISWWSNADCASESNCNYDRLDTDLNLAVYAPDGSLVSGGYSASWDNNYELVDFTAPQTGQYSIGVYKASANETSNYVGVAWVKDGTYLPDLANQYNGNGRVSELYLQNEGSLARNVTVSYINPDGSIPSYASDTCYLTPNQTCRILVSDSNRIPNGGIRSAIVNGGEDVSVAVANQRLSSPYSNGAYTGVQNGLTSGTYYVPTVLRNRSGASGVANTEFAVQNVGLVPMTIQIQLIAWPGTQLLNFTKTSPTIAAGATYRYYLVNESPNNVPDQWYGSAIVTAGGPIAVLSNMVAGSNIIQTINAFQSGNVGPVWMVTQFTSRLANGLSTVLSVQNVSGSTIDANGIQLYCTKDPASPDPATFTVYNGSTLVPNNGGYSFNPVVDITNFPTAWYGSCKVTATANVVVYVQMRFVGGTGNPEDAAAYDAVLASGVGRVIVFPRIRRQPNGTTLASAIGIQNLSTTIATTVVLNYYHNTDCSTADVLGLQFTIQPGASLLRNHRFDDLPIGWCGSLVVSSSVTSINGYAQLKDINTAPGMGDTFMAYDAVTRP
jgi:hypothetical protein